MDFAHIYARNQGKINYDDVSKKIKDIKNLTAHFSGINYGLKGEKNHIPTPKEEAERSERQKQKMSAKSVWFCFSLKFLKKRPYICFSHT